MRPDPSTLASPPNGCEPKSSELDRAVDVTRSLVDAMEGTSVSRLVVCAGAVRIEVERSAPRLPAATVSEGDAAISTAQNGMNAAIAGPSAAPTAPTAPVSSAAAVRAPLVGVFYRRPEPGKPPMAEVGDRVEAGQPLAIVEAMKMMNEVVASVAGTIIGIHAEDQDVVEFDELLFTIEEAA